MKSYLALTIIADDRHGIVDRLAGVIRDFDASWLDSSLSTLAGKFAGILLIDVAEDRRDALVTALESLEHDGIRVVAQTTTDTAPDTAERIDLSLESSDRLGIVSELSRLLAAESINLEQLSTRHEAASMSGTPMFYATARVELPEGMSRSELRRLLETLSPDLMVEFLHP